MAVAGAELGEGGKKVDVIATNGQQMCRFRRKRDARSDISKINYLAAGRPVTCSHRRADSADSLTGLAHWA